MICSSKNLTPVVIALGALVLYSRPAHAYLDPATGSVVIQVIVAAIAGAGMAMKIYWHRIKAFFNGKKAKELAEGDLAQQEVNVATTSVSSKN